VVVPPVPEKTARTYDSRLTTLVHTLTDLPETVAIKCSPAADHAVIKLQEDIEPKLRPEGALAHIDDWAGKYVGAVARIAGLLHLGDHVTGRWGQPIEAATIERAIAIGEYYTAHALAAFDLMTTEPAVDDARAVLGWLARSGRTQFKAKDVVADSRRFKTVASVGPALTTLEEHGFVRVLHSERSSSRGRQPAATYRIHPSWLRTMALTSRGRELRLNLNAGNLGR
jgi:replicative DNA helicase